MRSPNIPRSSCSLQPSSTKPKLKPKSPTLHFWCFHSPWLWRVAFTAQASRRWLWAATPRAAKKCENGCHVLRKFALRNRSPGSGELKCFLSIPGNNSFIWWNKTWCFKFLQFNLESKNRTCFLRTSAQHCQFHQLQANNSTRHRFLSCCCTNHSPQLPITLLLTCPLILTLMSRWG